MLVVDIYSLLPAFTLASFLIILLWPENIAFKNRLRLFMAILSFWVVMSFIGLTGYGTTEKPAACLINLLVGLLGLIALFVTYRAKPQR
jgi:hypothetical protein